jgi:hypothetical protein
MTYGKAAAKLLPDMVRSLKRNRFQPEALVFGEPDDPDARIYVPTHADSKFIAEQALGDWAEFTLAAAINQAKPEWKAVHYGSSGKLMAGETGFQDAYRDGVLETRAYGKRPDLLILPAQVECPSDVSQQPICDLDELVSQAIGSVEVRSSRLEARTYVAERAKQIKAGKKGIPAEPSITVKVEDLQKVYRWATRCSVSQVYAQVFFDDVHAMNFLDIMSYIAATDRLRIENPARSRKTTIMIPLSKAMKIGQVVEEPFFEVAQKTTLTGRRVIYAEPLGGEINVDPAALKHAVLGWNT